jgi:hypothetical protein
MQWNVNENVKGNNDNSFPLTYQYCSLFFWANYLRAQNVEWAHISKVEGTRYNGEAIPSCSSIGNSIWTKWNQSNILIPFFRSEFIFQTYKSDFQRKKKGAIWSVFVKEERHIETWTHNGTNKIILLNVDTCEDISLFTSHLITDIIISKNVTSNDRMIIELARCVCRLIWSTLLAFANKSWKISISKADVKSETSTWNLFNV